MSLGQIKKIIDAREKVDGATFDSNGALNPVSTGTFSTPVNVPSDMKTYEPKTQ
ncbi:MAG: hypothetical protein IPM95_00170 [Sphingobacteriales bacterium]|jgi:hypothetical protein|nr:hypothetical protein [Sphingobacteriales bacterium]